MAPRDDDEPRAGRQVELKPRLTPYSAWPRNESSPLIASAPRTAPQRLVIPPTTSIAS